MICFSRRRYDVIIFDEATSALDNETERKVIESIAELGKEITVLIIAHRLTTLSDCDKIVEINNGRISRIDSYENMVLPAY